MIEGSLDTASLVTFNNRSGNFHLDAEMVESRGGRGSPLGRPRDLLHHTVSHDIVLAETKLMAKQGGKRPFEREGGGSE